jgi:phosphohistidine phosphatase SixA
VEITFVSEDRSVTRKVTTDDRGFYRIALTRGRYVVSAAHCRYLDYSSAPGFFVVTGTEFQTGNIFLKKKQVTTVLLVRHGEKSNDALTTQGLARAEKLAHAARKAGIKAIYTTNFNRTRQTVQPLAQALNLQPIVYNDNAWLVSQVMANHRGDVVLVAGHSNTVPEIITALGGDRRCCPIDDEFDNLCLVVICEEGKASVIHLQYGDPSP